MVVVIVISEHPKRKRMKTKSSALKNNVVPCLFLHISAITETSVHILFYSTIISSTFAMEMYFLFTSQEHFYNGTINSPQIVNSLLV